MTSRAEETSANGRLLDRAIYHAILSERFKNHEVRRIVRLLDREVLPDLRERLASRLQNIAARGFDTGPTTTKRLRFLFRDLGKLFSDLVVRLNKDAEANLVDFAAAQADALARELKREVGSLASVATPSTGMLRQAVLRRPFDGFLLKERWDKRGRAFREAVEQQVRIGLVQGEAPEAIIGRVREVWPAQRRHVAATVRAGVAHAQNQGRQATYEENRRLLRGVMWVATLDVSTCPLCGGLDGQVFEPDEGPRPPMHFNCVTGDARVFSRGAVRAATSRVYEGDLVVIETAAGHKLTCTPNHPILTPRGWLPARLLYVGGHVVRDLGADLLSRPEMDNQKVPARIEDVARAPLSASAVRPKEVPVSAEDFHGDGLEGQIAVVRADRELLDRFESSITKQAQELYFTIGYQRRKPLGFRCRCGHELAVGLSPTSRSDMRSLKLVGAGRAGHRGPLQALGFRLTPARHATLPENSRDDVAGHPDEVRQVLLRATGQVALDKIVGVKVVYARCQVFNLDTSVGWYSANGIVSHNCRCTTVPVLRSASDLGGTRASMDGQVPESTTFEEWIGRQSPERQERAFGRGRARLFRSGRIDLEDMVDGAGNVIPLAELVAAGRE